MAHELNGETVSLSWDSQARIVALNLAGRAVPQERTGRYFVNGQPVEAAPAPGGRGEVVHTGKGGGGQLTARWRSGKGVSVTLDAAVPGGQVREVGFSLSLPPGDLLALMSNPYRFAAYAPGQKISFTEFPLGVGQIYLLDTGNGCLRFGRQVPRKRDYPTGCLERTADGWQLTWLWEPQLPYGEQFTSQEFHLAAFDSVAVALDDHRAWAEKEFGWLPVDRNPKVPGWLKESRLLVQINLGETNGAVVHDFTDVARLADDLNAMGVPPHTFLYIPDYNPNSQILRGYSGPLASCWPDNPLLGGKRAFGQMVETARKYDYHILPHGFLLLLLEWTSRNFAGEDGQRNIWRNPAWDRALPHAIRNAAGKPIGWPPDESADRYPYMCRYVNLSAPEMREWYLEQTSGMIREYGLDAYYFDSVSVGPAISYQGNIPHLAEIIDGERAVLDELQARHPDVLFAGELCDEDNAGLVPLWQERSAFSHALFGPYIYTFAHTSTPGSIPQRYSDWGISLVTERALQDEIELTRRQPNNIPRLLINYRDFGLDDRQRRAIEALLASRPLV